MGCFQFDLKKKKFSWESNAFGFVIYWRMFCLWDLFYGCLFFHGFFSKMFGFLKTQKCQFISSLKYEWMSEELSWFEKLIILISRKVCRNKLRRIEKENPSLRIRVRIILILKKKPFLLKFLFSWWNPWFSTIIFESTFHAILNDFQRKFFQSTSKFFCQVSFKIKCLIFFLHQSKQSSTKKII